MMLALIYGILLSATTPGQPATGEGLFVADTIKTSSRNKEIQTDTIDRFLEVNRIIITGNNLTRNSIILR